MKTLALLLPLAAGTSVNTMYITPGEECGDIWRNDYDILDPWPERCQVYKTSSPCGRYEMSEDGQTVLSCELPEMCAAVMTDPECL